MKIIQIQAKDQVTARNQVIEQYGVKPEDLKLVKENPAKKQYSFEALNCPPVIELDVSPDKMRARIRRIQRPIGNDAPKLTTDFVLEQLTKKGITFGVKTEHITEELFKVLSDKNSDEKRLLNIVVAEGVESVPAQGGRPQWVLDLRLFNKDKPVYCKSGEILARAPIAVKGQDGITVSGEKIPFRIEDQFRLQTGKGITTKLTKDENLYVTEGCGQLFFDHGVRLRLESEVLDRDDGLRAAIMVGKESFSKQRINGKDLLDTAKMKGLAVGLLTEAQIQKEIDSTKSWPAEITVARGKTPVDGKAGKVELVYQKPASNSPIDLEKAKEAIVFPGDLIAIIDPPLAPSDGQTVFGEVLRGRSYNEMPIYPGKGVEKTRLDGKDFLKAAVYGRVTLDKDRVSVENILQVEKDGSKASLDIFPQKPLLFENVLGLMRDKDVLAGFDKDKLSAQLDQVHKSGLREKALVVAQSQPVRLGKNAKLKYFFKPDEMQDKGLLLKTKGRQYFAAPGDLLLEKTLPVDAEPGFNIYRERVEVAQQNRAIDVTIKTGDNITETDLGKYGDENDPARVEYRASTFGFVKWENKSIDIVPMTIVGPNEEFFKIKICSQSDFGTKITYPMIEKLAEEESVRVPLNKKAIEGALKKRRTEEDPELVEVEIATSVPSVEGTDAVIEYFVEFNGKSIDDVIDSKDPKVEEPFFCDCVRPGEIVASKTPAGVGQDGMTVFGRKIIAGRGADEPWLTGYGIDRNEDGTKLIVTTKKPGFVVVQDKRLQILEPIEIASDKMSAKMRIFPSKSPRFQPREEKIMEMIKGSKIVTGIKIEEIREAISRVQEKKEPVELVIAEGKKPQEGREARHRFAIEVDGQPVGKSREDGSIDYKAAGVFQMVKPGQLLMVKQEATRGADGFNIFGEKMSGLLGKDRHIDAGQGVRLSSNGLEYEAIKGGIVEFTGKTIQVIEGLLINGNVDVSTGSIDAGKAQVMVRGSVNAGFHITSDLDISVDKEAEACRIESDCSIRIRGGIVGNEKAFIKAKAQIDALYINSGATVEAGGDIVTENECLNSLIRTGGRLLCRADPGTVSGGEIWAWEGVLAKNIGAAGSERPTRIILGVEYMALEEAKKRVEDEGLNEKELAMLAELKALDKELRELYDQIPRISQTDPKEASKLQQLYRDQYEIRRNKAAQLEVVKKQKEVILGSVPRNKGFRVEVLGMIHPGTTFIFESVEWVLKEPLRSVQILWNETSSNFMIRRL
ncbi:MAG: hypothetical protein COV44_11035 [Deltaproteobacteria bacterium CG11_big_fil_rev_8_21_14_0_20_45_16]|nr:MAG: hypothetical protein COV44_11035 [Deltaproteobacteria bacterium CG11_big_fil_rev_8_21_14_0_20_45_16]